MARITAAWGNVPRMSRPAPSGLRARPAPSPRGPGSPRRLRRGVAKRGEGWGEGRHLRGTKSDMLGNEQSERHFTR